MDFGDYLRIIWRNSLVLLACLIVGGGVGAVVGGHATKQYASTSQLLVTTPPVTASQAYASAIAAQGRATTLASIMRTQEITTQVVSQLSLSTSPTQLIHQIRASVQPNSSLIDIKVSDAHAAAAQQINVALLAALKSEERKLELAKDPTTGKTAAQVFRLTTTVVPSLPTSPTSSKRLPDIAIGLVLGLFIGLLLALVREQLDRSVRDLVTVPELGDAPVLATVPADRGTGREPLISDLAPESKRREAYQLLATNLHFIAARSGAKTIAIASTREGDGKTTNAVNLAVVAAEADSRVLLMDTNLRKPSVARLLGVDDRVGLTSVLTGERPFDAVVQQHESGLHVLAAGPAPSDAAALLQTRAMSELLAQARVNFDLVVLDTASLLGSADGVAAAGHADAAVLIVDRRRTTTRKLSEALQRLQAVGVPLLGIVSNKASRGHSADRRTPVAVRATPLTGQGGGRRSSAV